jgi:hypothetical protein
MPSGLPLKADIAQYGRHVSKVPILLQKSLRDAANRDSVVLTRISARSIHDGPSEE